MAIGTLPGPSTPKTPTFRDFPGWFRAERKRLLAKRDAKPPKVAMFCTGGGEKSTAFLKSEGWRTIYLQGGIPEISGKPCPRRIAFGRASASCSTIAFRSVMALPSAIMNYAMPAAMIDARDAPPLYEGRRQLSGLSPEPPTEQRAAIMSGIGRKMLAAARGRTTCRRAVRAAGDDAD